MTYFSANQKIASIIGNQTLATAVYDSVNAGLECPFVHLASGETVWDIFKNIFDSMVQEIEGHPRNKIFQRFVKYGPLGPNEPESFVSDKKTILSDSECGLCVEFIYIQMINRFRDELAQLLAVAPLIKLIGQLRQNGGLPSDIQVYLGGNIQERLKFRVLGELAGQIRWSGYLKGADGLIVGRMPSGQMEPEDKVKILSVIEVKSSSYNKAKMISQINQHVKRLSGGVKLCNVEWASGSLLFAPLETRDEPAFLNICVVPSTWKLSRKWERIETGGDRVMAFPEPSKTLMQSECVEFSPNCWQIKLPWSQEALSQAAYEMVFWYMDKVGSVPATGKLSAEFDAEEEAGCSPIKMRLHYLLLRFLSERRKQIAISLYNAFCFGYPLGADSKKMLRPEDFPDKVE